MSEYSYSLKIAEQLYGPTVHPFGPSYESAYTWYKIAQLNGRIGADKKVASIWEKYKGQPYGRTLVDRTIPLTQKENENRRKAYIWCDIAFFYAEGIALQKNLDKAETFYREADELGQSCGVMETALRYKIGLGVEQDLKKARELYSEQEHFHARYQYALMLENGLGGSVDLIGAYKSLSKTNTTYTLTRYHLLLLKQKMTNEQIAEAERQLKRERGRR